MRKNWGVTFHLLAEASRGGSSGLQQLRHEFESTLKILLGYVEQHWFAVDAELSHRGVNGNRISLSLGARVETGAMQLVLLV